MILQGDGSIQQVDKSKPRSKCRKWRIFQRADGRQHSRVVGGTYTDAKNALRAFRDELAAKVSETSGFPAYARKWASWRADSGDFSPNTVHKDATQIRCLSKHFDCDLEDITPMMVKDAFSSMETSGTYRNAMFIKLKCILQSAVDDGLLTSNPCAKLKAPKVDTEEKDAMGREEMSAMLDAMDSMPMDGRLMAVYLMLLLGLRRAECCALRWEDVGESRITVRHAVKERSGEIGQTKNGMVRVLPIPSRLSVRLSEWHDTCAELGDEWVCPATNGAMMYPQNLYKWWMRHRAELGADGYSLHQLRHSNLTVMARSMSVFGLMRWAGWKDMQTAKIYVHDDFSELEDAACAVGF